LTIAFQAARAALPACSHIKRGRGAVARACLECARSSKCTCKDRHASCVAQACNRTGAGGTHMDWDDAHARSRAVLVRSPEQHVCTHSGSGRVRSRAGHGGVQRTWARGA